MKTENEERFVVNIPLTANEQLEELRKSVYPPLNKGQMAAVAIAEKHRREMGGNGREGSIPLEQQANAGERLKAADELAKELWEGAKGKKNIAILNIPIGHPLKMDILRAIEKMAKESEEK